MKTLSVLTLVSLSLTLSSQAQNSSSAPAGSASAPQDTPWSIVSRDANSRLHQRTTYEQDPSGQWIPTTHSFTEIASGICYQQDGQWVDSVEEIDPLSTGGAQAVQLQQKVAFPYDIYNGVIQVVTPDGKQLQSRPLGVSFFDGTNSVLIAELTNSIGQIISSNQIIYTNAFTDFPADLLISCRKSGLECDLVLRSQIPDPQAYGLSASSTRLELLTEFFGTPEPEETLTNTVGGLSDVTLGFGKMKMVRGKAFKSGATASHMEGVPVAKSWTHINGRTFLIEEVSYPLIDQQLQALPALATATGVSRSIDSALHRVSASRLLPLARAVQPATNAIRFARTAMQPNSGMVLDYVLLNGSTNFIFRGDTTYLVSGLVNLYGITTFEGGTVIKYDSTKTNSAIQNWGNVNFETAPYHSAIFTSCNDNTVGESITISNATYYYNSALFIDAGAEPVTVQNVRFSYALWGLHPYGDNFTLNNAQFVNCSNAFYPEYTTANINNILIANVNTAFGGINYGVNACQMTVANCVNLQTTWGSPSASWVTTTNSLLYNVATNETPASTNIDSPMITGQIFQTAGAGSYYLATNSPYRNAGITNIDPTLLAALRQETTYPPLVYSNVTITTNLTLGPLVPRDTNGHPDLGYHYAPLDYCFGGVTASSNLTFDVGTAVGWFEVAGKSYGIALSNGSTNSFNGTATAPAVFARYNTVQEGGNGNWALKGVLAGITTVGNSSYIADIEAQFAHCYLMAEDPNHFRDDLAKLNVHSENCEFYGGSLAGYWLGIFATNCLFDRVQLVGSQQKSDGIFLRNCTMHGSTVFAQHNSGLTWPVWVENCAFDGSGTNMDNPSGAVYCNYNAFLNGAQRLIIQGSNDVVVTNTFTWQTGPLGSYYQSPTSPLINTGSVTADIVGLYHFTTQTNQIEETNSIVDIGYHYLSLNPIGVDTGPSVQLVSPSNQVLNAETPVSVQATATPFSNSVPVQYVEFLVGTNGGPITNIIGAAVGPTNLYQISWTPPIPGSFVLQAEAVDSFDMVGFSPPVTNSVRSVPQVQITSPTNNQVFLPPSSTNITVTASATASDGASITSVVYYQGTTPVGTNLSGPYSISWNPATNGIYTLSARATDSTGLVGQSSNITVTVELTNQPLRVFMPPNQTNYLSTNWVPLVAFVSDDVLRVGTLSVNWTNLTGSGNVTFTNSAFPVAAAQFSATGTYVLQLIASDSQYRVTNTMTMTILPANQMPSIGFGWTNRTIILPAAPGSNFVETIQMNQIANNTNNLCFGLDYFPPSNCVIVAQAYEAPSSFALMFSNGNFTNFSSIADLGDTYVPGEIYLATVRNTIGGFKIGEMFCGNGVEGQIMRIEPDGTAVGTNVWSNADGVTQSNVWVCLTNVPGAPQDMGAMQGGLWVDRTGVWGGDLIVTTEIGYVWRINSQGKATLVASLPVNGYYDGYEGITTIPDDVQRYGPWAGRILVGADRPWFPIYAIDTNGVVTSFNLGIGSEDIRVIPAAESFYAVGAASWVYMAPASQFQGMAGDILIASEVDPAFIYRLHWNGSKFDIYPINTSGYQWAQGNFIPAGPSNISTAAVQLEGTVTDDGELFAPTINHWSALSNADSVQFVDASLTNTLVEFATTGTYALQLSAYDGQYTTNRNVVVTVLQNQAPTVIAGTNQTIITTNMTLQGVITDDLLPSNVVHAAWSVASGDSTQVHFGSSSLTNSTVRFDSAGTYVLMLTGDDGWSTNFAQVTINVKGPSLSLSTTNGPVSLTNTAYTLKATVLNTNGNPVTNTSIEFKVNSGPDSTIDQSIMTDSHGVASWTITNSGFGIDTVNVSVVSVPGLAGSTNEQWGASMSCGSSYAEESDKPQGCQSIEFPGLAANYYFIDGQAGKSLNLYLTQVAEPLVLILRDTSNGQVVAESSVEFTQPDTVVELPYNSSHDGVYLLEVAEVFANSLTYDLQLSCGIGPQMSILYNGAAVPNGGTVVFPTTAQGSPTNVLLTITNGGDAPFKILGIGTNGDFVLTNSVLDDIIAAAAWTNFGVKFNASSNGVSFGALALVTDNGLTTNYTVYLEGTTFPTSAVPTVQLNYPTNGSAFLDTENIPFSATVTAGSAAISAVQLLTVTTNGLEPLHGINSAPLVFDSENFYTNTFAVSQIVPNIYAPDGDYALVAFVSDVSGQTNISAPILVHFLPPTTTNVTVSPELLVSVNQSTATNGGTIVFPNTSAGYPTNITLVISNGGNYPLAITNFDLQGDFSVSSDAANNLVNGTIAAGASTNLTITFNASSSGSSVGEVVLANNVENSGVYSTYLMGNAYPTNQGLPSNSILPVAANEQFHVLANSQNNILMLLAQDSDANGYALRIVSASGSEGGTVGVIGNGAAISYTPPKGIRSYPGMPADGFTYVISDGHGGTASGTISIIIDASDIPEPIITYPPSGYSTNAGSVVPLTVAVTNSPNVTEVDFYVGSVEIAVVTNGVNGQWSTNWTAVADADTTIADQIEAVAKDKFGQVGVSGIVGMNVTLPPNSGQDIAALDSFVDASGTINLSATNLNLIRDGLLNLNGRATNSQGSNVVWQLGIYGQDGTLIRNLTPLMSGSVGTANGPALLLSNCDLTTLQNGVYNLTLTVTGGNEMNQTTVQIQLESNLKIGQFSFSQQDLVIPVNGVPLTVTRTYNSLNPDQGDFGKGWTYALADLDVQFDEDRKDVVDTDGNTFSERIGGGRDITLTLPNGQRTTFYFTLQPGGDMGGYQAIYQAAPGVTATLTPMGSPQLETLVGSLSDNSDLYYWDGHAGMPMDAYDFQGFYLTNLDGTAYVITRDDLGDHFIDNGGEGAYVQAYGAAHLSQIFTRNDAVTTIGLNSIVTTSPTGATNQITFQHNTAGLITSISDPVSVASNGPPAMIYQYDQLNNLIAVERLVDRSGSGTYVTNSTFTYTNQNFPHYVTGIINADGTPVAENFYDDSGKLTAVQDANGNLTQFVHNPTNDMEVIVDRNGNTNTYVYDLRGNVIAQTNQVGQITTMAYDANNNKTNEVMYMNGVPYSTNSYVYDTNNLLLISIDPLNHGTTNKYDSYGNVLTTVDALGHGITNAYDSNGNLIGTTNALGNTTLNSYSGGLLLGSVDADGNMTTNAYDSNDNLIGSQTLDASHNIVSSNSVTYDENNNQVTSTVWRRVGGMWTNATTTNVYDAESRVIQTMNPDGGTNTTVYNADGTRQYTKDALGHTTSYIYDSQLRLKETDYPDGTATQTVYDNNGNRTQSVDQTNQVTSYFYDALNRVTNTIYADNTTNTTVYDGVGRTAQSIDARGTVTAYDYDVAGRQVAVTNAFQTAVQMVSKYIYDADGNQTVFTDANNHSVTNVYDALNRQVQTLYADGTTNSTGFDAAGRKVAQTNQDGIVTLIGYDGAGRLISVTNALGKPEQMVTQYQYDEVGNEIAQVDALGRTNVFTYDGMGRRVAHSRPDRQTEYFVYDTGGNLVCQTNFDTSILTNGYDSMNRLINRGVTGLINPGQISSYSYTPTGQRASMISYAGEFDCAYFYDSRDRLVRKTSTWKGPGAGTLIVSLNYGYDTQGNLTNLASSMGNGVNLTYSYDPLNRITNVLSHSQLAASYTFDVVGNLQGMKYGNGLTNLYQHDSLNRLTNLMWMSNSSPLAKFYYQLGKTGNRTNLSETITNTSRTYSWTYDNLYRLSQEIISNTTTGVSGNVGYHFDGVGNRLVRTNNAGSFGVSNQQFAYNTNDWLSTDGYDDHLPGDDSSPGNGNTTSSGLNSYGYDVLNRLVNSGETNLVYDADGNRIAKTADNNQTWTYYLVDDRNPTGYPQVVEEYQAFGGPQLVYLKRAYNYGLSLISQQQYDENTLLPSTLSYYGMDGHGSVRFLTDTNQQITDTYAYDAYGTLIAANGSTPNSYLYAGEQLDSDLGLYYLRARYYKPDTGRFWTADAVQGNTEDPLSLHKYMYAESDPANNLDPSGNEIECAMDLLSIDAMFAGIGFTSPSGPPLIWAEANHRRLTTGWRAGGPWSQPYFYGDGAYNFGKNLEESEKCHYDGFNRLWSGPADGGICNSIDGALHKPPGINGDSTGDSPNAGAFEIVARGYWAGTKRMFFSMEIDISGKGPEWNGSVNLWLYPGRIMTFKATPKSGPASRKFGFFVDMPLSPKSQIAIDYEPFIEYHTSKSTPVRQSDSRIDWKLDYLGYQ